MRTRCIYFHFDIRFLTLTDKNRELLTYNPYPVSITDLNCCFHEVKIQT